MTDAMEAVMSNLFLTDIKRIELLELQAEDMRKLVKALALRVKILEHQLAKITDDMK